MSVMTSKQSDECHNIDHNNSFIPMMGTESLRLPLDSSMRIVFTGYFNGFSVEVKSPDEGALLYHMGCFGKGTASRSKPKATLSNPCIIRKRQFKKRNYWFKKFFKNKEPVETDQFLKDLDELASKIVSDSKNHLNKDVIDLVSSDEDCNETNDEICSDIPLDPICNENTEDLVIIVPNSDSEDDNYFANLKPKCCLNKVQIQEKLMLTLQEAFFLLYGLGCLQVINNENKLLDLIECWDLFQHTDRNFIPKYVVYHYFRSKGYVVKPGVKFGGDYLLYKDGPGISHADYIVVIKNNDNNFKWNAVLGHVRMAVTTVKEMLIVEVIKSNGDIRHPEDLSQYSVEVLVLSRNMPVTINDD